VHGSQLVQVTELPLNISTYQKLFFEAFVLFPVDCFVLISGYYAINLRLRKTFSLWFQCFSYSVGITLLFYLVTNEVGIRALIKSFMPITFDAWWFVTCYFFLMLLSPALNLLANSIKKSMFEYLLAIGLIINCWIGFVAGNSNLGGTGSTLVNFVFIYFLGRYLKLHKELFLFSRLNLILSYSLCCIVTAVISIFLKYYFSGRGVWLLYQFNNPIIIFEAICIFYLFRSMNFKNVFVNKIGSMVFSVYLLHDNSLVRKWIYSNLFIIETFSGELSYILVLFVFALIIFFICIVIEIVRNLVTHPILLSIFTSNTFRFLETKLLSIQGINKESTE
jgi:hypothetical protein